MSESIAEDRRPLGPKAAWMGPACLVVALGLAAPEAARAVAVDLSTVTYNSAQADGLHDGGQGGTSRLLWSDAWAQFSTMIPGADFAVGQTVTYTDTSASGGIREFVENAISASANVNVTLGLGFVIREGNGGTTSTGWTIRSSEHGTGPAPILRVTTANNGVIDAVLVEDTYISSDPSESNTNFSGAATLNFRTHTSTWRNALIQFDLPLLPLGDSVVQVDLILVSASDPVGTGGTPAIEVVATAVPIPEPATAGLVAAAGCLLLGRRRK